MSGTLHLRVAEARGLRIADRNGSSDPYIKFRHGGTKYRTGEVHERLNPIFGHDFAIRKVKGDESLDLGIWDTDKKFISKGRDHLGNVRLELKSIPEEGLTTWCPVRHHKTGEVDPNLGSLRIVAWFQKEGKPDLAARDKAFNMLYSAEKKAIAEEKPIDVFVGTWNVGNAPPGDISAWISKGKHSVYVLGAQECKYDPREGFKKCEDDWKNSLQKAVGEDVELVKLASFGEMRIAVFCKKEVRPFITNVKSKTEATGIAHVVNNKGGVAVSLKYKDASIVFINAHLAAHQGEVKRRNSDVNEILNGIAKTLVEVPKNSLQYDFDHVVFMGDLNYRLDFGDQGDKKKPSKELFEKMCECVKSKKFDELLASDQLRREMNAGRVFSGFVEGKLEHEPTFKVLKNEDFTYNKERSPAYCDRILWHSNTQKKIVCDGPNAALGVTTSDHKPVGCVLSIPGITKPGILPAVQKNGPSCHIVFEKLQVNAIPKMDANGLADPYVEFISDILPITKKPPTTEVVPLSLDATFEKIPGLVTTVANAERLRCHRIVMRIMDRDKMNADDIIGYASLELHKAISPGDSNTSSTAFRLPVISRGGIHLNGAKCFVEGKVTVTFA